MGIKHAITRKTFEVTIDGAMKYINKDRRDEPVKTGGNGNRSHGGSYPDYVFDNARERFSHPEEKWMRSCIITGRAGSEHRKDACAESRL